MSVAAFNPTPILKPVTLLKNPKKLTFLTDAELEALPPPEYLIDDVLPARSTSFLYGKPGEGKTFAAVSMSGAIATGHDWYGHTTKRGLVVYVAAEGHSGLSLRLRAWKQVNKVAKCPNLRFMTRAVPFMDDDKVDEFIEALEALGVPIALVVIDTLSRCIVGGDENAPKDMGTFVAGADRIREATGATVLVIHHAGRKGASPRGHSSLDGAADLLLKASMSGQGVVTLACEKQKDSVEFDNIRLRLEPVNLPDGRTSCVLVPAAGGPEPSASKAKKPKVEERKRAIHDALVASGGKASSRDLIAKSRLSESIFFKTIKLMIPDLVVGAGKGMYALAPVPSV